MEISETKMKNRVASSLFLGVCVIVAILLITKIINIITSGAIFAIALIVFGLIPRGTGKRQGTTTNQ